MLTKCTAEVAKYPVKYLIRQRCADGFSSGVKGLKIVVPPAIRYLELEDIISAVVLTFQHFISGFLCFNWKFNTRASVWVVHTTGHSGSTTLATAKTSLWRHPWRPETCRRRFYASVLYTRTVYPSACKVGFTSWLLGPFLNNPFLPTTGRSSGGGKVFM
jgi:hypothetical protein